MGLSQLELQNNGDKIFLGQLYVKFVNEKNAKTGFFNGKEPGLFGQYQEVHRMVTVWCVV